MPWPPSRGSTRCCKRAPRLPGGSRSDPTRPTRSRVRHRSCWSGRGLASTSGSIALTCATRSSAAMRDALIEALRVVVADPAITDVRLSGSGPSFCSGGDLAEFGSAPDPATAHAVRVTRSAGAWLARCASRVTAEVHGACIGAGIELPAFAGRVRRGPRRPLLAARGGDGPHPRRRGNGEHHPPYRTTARLLPRPLGSVAPRGSRASLGTGRRDRRDPPGVRDQETLSGSQELRIHSAQS